MQKIKDLLLSKYLNETAVFGFIIALSLIGFIYNLRSEKSEKEVPVVSIHKMVPDGFVLVPIQISNSQDIINIIGSYGIVDLYSYSKTTNIPSTKVGSYIKIISPDTENSSFMALIPDSRVYDLFKHSPPFYAVIQSQYGTKTEVYKKKQNSLTIVEDTF